MKITVFTGNQPRHISLIESLAGISEELFAIQECVTVFPGKIGDFYRKSETMQRYFSHVLAAEETVFGKPRFCPKGVHQLVIKDGDLNHLELSIFGRALESDVFIVFGASFIKPPLIDILIGKGAYNIHMGVSPFYRGNSCNFWALHDDRPDYVGATIHMLSKGLDSGPMLFHAFPKPSECGPFVLGMRAVEAAHRGLVRSLETGELRALEPMAQDKKLELRYTRNSDFTDAVAEEFLSRLPTPVKISKALSSRKMDSFLRPFVG